MNTSCSVFNLQANCLQLNQSNDSAAIFQDLKLRLLLRVIEYPGHTISKHKLQICAMGVLLSVFILDLNQSISIDCTLNFSTIYDCLSGC